MTSVWLSLAVLAVITGAAEAQSASPVVTLKQGTEVRLKLGQRLSAKTSTINAPVELVLDEDLKAGDVVVANKGARVLGRVTEGKKDCVNGPCG